MQQLLDIMERLRRECPWDAEQTHTSLKPYLLEESYEVLEALDDGNDKLLAKELGDLLLQIVFHCQIAAEQNRFTFEDVVQNISTKLIDRHPHVFGDKKAHSARDVQTFWEQSKLKSEKRKSLLDGLPKAMPALLAAQRIQEKTASVGFEWDQIDQVFDKVDEEINEFKEAYKNGSKDKLREEFGDLFFALVNLGRFMQINAEDACRLANEKFIRRFQYIEHKYDNDPLAMKKASLSELDAVWNEAKEEGL